jgi:hypothetical protein
MAVAILERRGAVAILIRKIQRDRRQHVRRSRRGVRRCYGGLCGSRRAADRRRQGILRGAQLGAPAFKAGAEIWNTIRVPLIMGARFFEYPDWPSTRCSHCERNSRNPYPEWRLRPRREQQCSAGALEGARLEEGSLNGQTSIKLPTDWACLPRFAHHRDDHSPPARWRPRRFFFGLTCNAPRVQTGPSGVAKVIRGALARAFVDDHFKTESLALPQVEHARPLDRSYVNEHLRPIVVGLNEAITHIGVEPIHGTSFHRRPSGLAEL